MTDTARVLLLCACSVCIVLQFMAWSRNATFCRSMGRFWRTFQASCASVAQRWPWRWKHRLPSDPMLKRIEQAMAERRLLYVRVVINVLAATAMIRMIVIMVSMREGYLVESTHINTLTGAVTLLLGQWCPCLLRERNLPFWHFLLMVFLFAATHLDETRAGPMWDCLYLAGRLVLANTSRSLGFVLFTNFVAAVCGGVAAARRHQRCECSSGSFADQLVAEVVSLFVCMFFSTVWRRMEESEVKLSLEVKHGNENHSALKCLLDSSYDAIVELDTAFCIVGDARNFAGMMFVNPQKVLEGVPFMSFIAIDADKAVFREGFGECTCPDPATLASASYISLRDARGSVLQVEMFRVSVRGVATPSHLRHMIGVREREAGRNTVSNSSSPPRLHQTRGDASAGKSTIEGEDGCGLGSWLSPDSSASSRSSSATSGSLPTVKWSAPCEEDEHSVTFHAFDNQVYECRPAIEAYTAFESFWEGIVREPLPTLMHRWANTFSNHRELVSLSFKLPCVNLQMPCDSGRGALRDCAIHLRRATTQERVNWQMRRGHTCVLAEAKLAASRTLQSEYRSRSRGNRRQRPSIEGGRASTDGSSSMGILASAGRISEGTTERAKVSV